MSPNITDVRLSLSIGCKTADAENVETIVGEADREMYSTKICIPKESSEKNSMQAEGRLGNVSRVDGAGGEARIYEKAGYRSL
jgi:pyruvate-formate lyase